MLKKLYKHEFISLYRILIPLYSVLIGLSAVVRLLDFIKIDNDVLKTLSNIPITLTVIMIIAIFVVSIVVIIVRFYQNLLSKQGYLTFTLPFKPYNHILCKLICGTIVTITNALITILSIIIMLGTKDNLRNIYSALNGVVKGLVKLTGLGYAVTLIAEFVLLILISVCSSLLMFYASMAIGQQFKNKILGSVIAYFCIYAAIQTINTILLIIIITVIGFDIDSAVIANASISVMSQGFMLFMIAIMLLQGMIYYLITHFFLSKKLNLE